MKKNIFIIPVLILCLFNTSMSQITKSGVYDDFTLGYYPSRQTDSVKWSNGCVELQNACMQLFVPEDINTTDNKIVSTRDTKNNKLIIDLQKGYADYSSYEFTFGSYCNDGIESPFVLDLKDNSNISFNLELLDEYSVDTTLGVHLNLYLVDINGKQLYFDSEVNDVSDPGNSNWKYFIGITVGSSDFGYGNIGHDKDMILSSDGELNISYDFTEAWSSSKNQLGLQVLDVDFDFDYEKVVAVGLLFLSSHENDLDHYHAYPLKAKFSLSNFSVGSFKKADLGVSCDESLVLDSYLSTSEKYLFYPNPVREVLKVNFDYKTINIYNDLGILVLHSNGGDEIDVSTLEEGLYHLVSNENSFRFVKE